jgi:glycosyltransferase involved in cell wall biosynthesis
MSPIDIFMTTKNRPELLRKTLESFKKNTLQESYRLTLVSDGNYSATRSVTDDFQDVISYTLVNTENQGLGPSINMSLAHIDSLKKWDVDPSPLTLYIQDDVLFNPEWLQILSQKFLQLEKVFNLGFASGIECIEHPTKNVLSFSGFGGYGMQLKDWIRATCMLARQSYWMSMWPISRIDPETGRERGRPHDGLGSSVDWWFIRNHENSVCKTGKTNLVIPGLLQHSGYKDSTWLKRELPESDEDKEKIHG